MASHTVLIGYGDTGRAAADVLSIDQAHTLMPEPGLRDDTAVTCPRPDDRLLVLRTSAPDD